MSKKEDSQHRDRIQIPFGQILMDDMFLLLMVGIVVPFIIYMAWGYIDIGSVPPLPESYLSESTASPTQPPSLDGAQIVLSMGCLGCHSTDGTARVGPSWKGLFGHEHPMEDGSLMLADEAYIKQSILEPDAKISHGYKPGIMPSFAGRLTDQEMDAIIEYIKGLE